MSLWLGGCSRLNQPQPAAPIATIQLPSFASLVKQAGPAVVNISSTRTIRGDMSPFPNLPEDDPLYEFFRRFMPPSSTPREFQARSLGSGFIISQDGYILTNAHVVAETDEINIKLTTKREFKAKVIGADMRTDIALVKIDATGLPVVNIGNPEKLEVGEWVAAIGAPFGFENSVTAGIVSAKGRSLPEESYVPFIQTDVALNPGNSGGPLFNMRGEVVGISSQIYSQTGGYMGVSFAIPIDIAMDIVKQLRATGKVTRGKIGVQVQEVTQDLAASFGLKDANGALVVMVEAGGPADKAGIRSGDIILSFDGKPVQESNDLSRLVASTRPGSVVNVELWRNRARQVAKVTMAELAQEKAATEPEETLPESANKAGLVLSELTSEQRSRAKVDHGLLVRKAHGIAARAGIEPDDIILAVNNVPTTTVADFEEQLKRNTGKAIALLVRRDEDMLYLPLRVAGR
ncbi:MAG TPA: DegQ family serine endoprotease [Burkholderiaceae bacterium]|nr:DegQ family serine endoprotease [Burkholderiaceae bacterium]